MIPPTLLLQGFPQSILIPSKCSEQGFRGLMASLIMSFLYGLVLTILMELGEPGALNAASDKSFSNRKFFGQVNDG